MMHRLAAWLRRRAENVAAGMIAVMFVAFVIQIVFRYVFNFPVGWTSELSVVMWLWLVLWGAAFVLKEREEIRFDLLSGAARRPTRIAMGIAAAAALLVLYGASLPATYRYVTFMRVESSSYLNVRMDVLFSIYLIFLVAIVARYLWILWRLLHGTEPRDVGGTGASPPP